jgi:hypothetical protein
MVGWNIDSLVEWQSARRESEKDFESRQRDRYALIVMFACDDLRPVSFTVVKDLQKWLEKNGGASNKKKK